MRPRIRRNTRRPRVAVRRRRRGTPVRGTVGEPRARASATGPRSRDRSAPNARTRPEGRRRCTRERAARVPPTRAPGRRHARPLCGRAAAARRRAWPVRVPAAPPGRMRVRARDLFATIRSEGALLPPELLARIAENDRSLDGLTPDAYHLP